MECVAMIEFSGIDIILERQINDTSIRQALAASLGVPENRVIVIDDMSKYPESAAADVVCVTSSVEGEFIQLLSVQAGRLLLPYDEPLALIQSLCELLGTRCLAPDDDADPYCMWLISPGTARGRIQIDPIAFDDDRYVISRPT